MLRPLGIKIVREFAPATASHGTSGPPGARATHGPKRKTRRIQIGAKFYDMTSDDAYLDKMGRRFEPAMVRLFETLVKKDHQVLDVGANIGFTAILFGERCRSVHAFEPSPTTFDLLKLNLAASGLKNVVLHNLGLGESEIDSQITYLEHFRAGGTVANKIEISDGYVMEPVKIARLDQRIQSLGISKLDFIKIDVEGYERSVLLGAKETLAKHKPVVLSELNHWALNAYQRISIPDHFDFLRSLFPVLFAIDEHESTISDLHNAGAAFTVMEEHILNFKYSNIIGAFDQSQVDDFRRAYRQV